MKEGLSSLQDKPLHTKTHKVAIVGSPNVGKSVLFNALTGAYVAVSNYPGTTVEISRGKFRLGEEEVEIIDTPGMYSLSPITEEERVARTLLREEKPEVILQVVDARSLGRMLPFTLQLLEAGLPLMLVVNVLDEATRLGMKIDCERLEQELGIAVIPTISVTGEGLDKLRERLQERLSEDGRITRIAENNVSLIPVSRRLANAVEGVEALLQGEYAFSRRTVSRLLIGEDSELLEAAKAREGKGFEAIHQEIHRSRECLAHAPDYIFWMERQKAANRLMEIASSPPTKAPHGAAERLSNWMVRPVTGLPILLVVLYVGLFLFVGKFGAGILVDLLEERFFSGILEPHITAFVERIIPWVVVQDLFVHEYGLITLGLKYAVAIILPIVATFFLVFAVIEDSGYLPRLALLIDRFFKLIGLSGRAVIPLVLGFGCGTMATLVTRVLETRRERVIATLLLALAIPCSAQLGVIMGLLSGSPAALGIWIVVVGLVFLAVGFLSAKVLKGERASFYIEVPPLRWPKLKNVLSKSYARMKWYFMEILPLFLAVSVIIWVGRQIPLFGNSLFDWIILGLQPLVAALGLPEETATAFLFGFFRRDYGAAGLFDLHSQGLLGGVPLVVAMVTMTLFLPCVAQWLIMQKERGLKTTLAIIGFIFPFAWIVGFALYRLLDLLGVKL